MITNIIEGLLWTGGLLIWSCAVGRAAIRLHRWLTHPCDCGYCEMERHLLMMGAWEAGRSHGQRAERQRSEIKEGLERVVDLARN